MLHKMISGSFKEGTAPHLALEDVDASVYSDVMDLWNGSTEPKRLMDKSLGAVMTMASVADRLLMTDVGMVLEEAIITQLSVSSCVDMLISSVRLGLGCVEAAVRRLTLDRFEEVIAAASGGFLLMGEEVLGSLLEDDELSASREESVLEAVVGWMNCDGGELRGRGLLSKIRYGVMDPEYLAVDVHLLLPAEHADWIDGFVLEALRINGAGHRRDSIVAKLLGEKAYVRRPSPGVRWERHGAGGDNGERRLQGHRLGVCALAECKGWMCSGSMDGSIRVWGGATMEHERTIRDEEMPQDGVHSLAAWEGHLISGYSSSAIRVWNVATGALDRSLEGHTGPVKCLAVSGNRLVSGSHDRSVKVWAMRAGTAWPCELTLVFGGRDGVVGGEVNALAIWRGKVLSGSVDKSVRVWDMEAGTHDTALTGHTGEVRALVVHGDRDRLFSGSADGTIREWALGTWVALRSVELGTRILNRPDIMSLVMIGSKLISTSKCTLGDSSGELQVWGLWSMKRECSVPTGAKVCCLAAGSSCSGVTLWGGVGQEIVVWGLAQTQ